MSIFQQLESMMNSSMRTEEFEMVPGESKYEINFNGAPCCVVDFVNQKTEESDDFEIAQEEPGQYIVYLTNVKDKVKSDEYQGKLKKMGFNKISVYEDADPEVDSVPEEEPKQIESNPDKINKILKLLDNIEFEDADGLSLGSLRAIGDIRKEIQSLNIQSQEESIESGLKPGMKAFSFRYQLRNIKDKTVVDSSSDLEELKSKRKDDQYIYDNREKGRVEIQVDDMDEGQINESSNEEVIDLFINDNFPHDKDEANKMGIKRWMSVWGSNNLKISKQNNGWALVNYNTPILFRDDEGMIYFNTDKYSVTTSKIQNQIRKSLSGKEFKEVDEKTIREKIQ
jgi:hypothetical protein